jgi:hypothetical protein
LPFASALKTAKSAFEVPRGSALKMKPIDGTRIVASSCAAALKPSNRSAARVFVFHGLVGCVQDQLEVHQCRSCFCVHRGPARLVNDGHVRHLQGCCFADRTEGQAVCWRRCDPIQPFRRDRRIEFMDLVCGDRRSLEYRQSGVGENSLVRLTSGKVLTRQCSCSRSWQCPRRDGCPYCPYPCR